jgi:hypothetical protein
MRLRSALFAMLLMSSVGCQDRPKPTPVPEAASAPAPVASSAAVAKPKVHTKELLSPVYAIDKIYPSMQGPSSVEDFQLLPGDEPELVWVVGFEAVMMDGSGDKQVAQDFMCHSNLDMEPVDHLEVFEQRDKAISGRLFTLSQGQQRIDLPEGFGIPMLSTEQLSLNTQVLNLNMKDGKAEVRHRVFLRFVRDKDLTKPYQALYSAGAYGLKLLEGGDGHYGADGKGSDDNHGAACLPGENAGTNVFDDTKGRKFTGHWKVKPGREENHTRVTDIMGLPWDTTLHYVAVHLHPFAESLELRDRTTGKTVYKASTKQLEGGIGLAHVDHYSSTEGLKLFKDHEYEMISVYNNTSGDEHDSMAVFNLYILDKEFKKPDLEKVKAALKAKKAAAPAGSAAPKPDADKLM